MDYSSSHPFTHSSNFVDLLNSQQELPLHDPFSSQSQIPLFSSQCTEASTYNDDSPADRKERKAWTPTDDVILISGWLNTSKDPVVGNEQKSGTFWWRIAEYIASSPKAAGKERREPVTCKARWQKINDLVCKFCGSYEAATRERASGMNENDVLKLAHQIFFNDYKKKFTLEHAWKELRNDQKWCEVSANKVGGSVKRRRREDGLQAPVPAADENNNVEGDQGGNRPPGVKAAKNKGKKKVDDGKALSEFQSMCKLHEKDMALKERIQRMQLLDSLVAKSMKEPLEDYEKELKKRLSLEMLG
ncbi:glutathione S-transferase T3-like [Eutrema salsugineum]|uniref:glutathione S-transferase T3-like n=1 Tax=Eutrema salsugineum TaxID=72664 RepID=UPI000CECFC07|nr:glutathione S-transferase T3-like [Eutrema salsugineum]